MGGIFGLLFRRRNRTRECPYPLQDEHQLEDFEVKSYYLGDSDDESGYSEPYNMIVPGSASSTQSGFETEAGATPQQPITKSSKDKLPIVLTDKYASSEEQNTKKGSIIEEIFRRDYDAMIRQVDPVRAARCLYSFGIINDDECESAMLDKLSKSERSSKLLLNLIRKLRGHPIWCNDAIVALKEGGVNMESIITALIDAGIDVKSNSKKLEAKKCDQNVFKTKVHFPCEDTPKDSSSAKCGHNEPYPDQHELSQPSQVSQPSPYDHQDQRDRHYHMQHDNHGQSDRPSLQYNQSAQDDQHKHGDPHVQVAKLDTVYESQVTPLRHPVHILHKFSEALFSIGENCHNHCEAASKTIISTLWESLGTTEREIADKDGNTPLHVAACEKNVPITEKILQEAPYMINLQNKKNQTALHLSVIHCSIMVATKLCECTTCYPYLLDNNGRTALHCACFLGVTELVKPLLKLCSEPRFINAADINGDTALHIATREGFTDIMRLLLKKKADKKIINHQRQTPKDIAKQIKNSKAIKRLSKFPYFHQQVSKVSRSSTSPALSTVPSMDSISTCSQVSSMCSALAELERDDENECD